MTCSNCGNDVAATEEFCSRCGRANAPIGPPGGPTDFLFVLGGSVLGFVLLLVSVFGGAAVSSLTDRGQASPYSGYSIPYVAVFLWFVETALLVLLLVWLFRGKRPRRWPRWTRLIVYGAAFVMLGGLALCDLAYLTAALSGLGRAAHR